MQRHSKDAVRHTGRPDLLPRRQVGRERSRDDEGQDRCHESGADGAHPGPASAAGQGDRQRRSVHRQHRRGPRHLLEQVGQIGHVGQVGQVAHRYTSSNVAATSASSGATLRSRARASWVWLFTVPTEQPSASAISRCDRSS